MPDLAKHFEIIEKLLQTTRSIVMICCDHASVSVEALESFITGARHCWPSTVEEAEETKQQEWRVERQEGTAECRTARYSGAIQSI